MPRNTKHLLPPRQAFVTAFLLIVSLAAQNRNPLAPAEERKTAVNLGDTACSLSIQSISKSVYLALAMQEHGAETAFEKIGSEPAGRACSTP